MGTGMGASGSRVHPAEALNMNDVPRYPRQSRLLIARRLATGALRYSNDRGSPKVAKGPKLAKALSGIAFLWIVFQLQYPCV